MKKAFLILVVIFSIGITAGAQQPVKWTYSAKKVADKTYDVYLTASIMDGWHIYSQQQPKDAIAFPTTIQFTKNPLFTCVGKVRETGKLQKAKIEVLDIVQHQYANKVEFVQTVKLKSDVKLQVNGSLKFEACTDEQCLPTKEQSFSVALE